MQAAVPSVSRSEIGEGLPSNSGRHRSHNVRCGQIGQPALGRRSSCVMHWDLATRAPHKGPAKLELLVGASPFDMMMEDCMCPREQLRVIKLHCVT